MKHDVYFGGAVQSFTLMTDEGSATVVVITPGPHTFDAQSEEHVRVITGRLSITPHGEAPQQ